jgi:hypothetical protein
MAESKSKKEMVTVPRAALQALAEYAYPVFASSRIWAKLPPSHPRWISWNIHDDLHQELERERMAFLKEIFWKAYNEAWKQEIGCHKPNSAREDPSLERFMECVAAMDDPRWDEPLTPKVVAERKKEIKASKAKVSDWKHKMEHPAPETQIRTMSLSGDISLHLIEENLGSDEPEIRAKAAEEAQRLLAELGKLKLTA